MYKAVGWGVNGEGLYFKLAMVNMCSIWPLLNKYAFFKNFEEGLETPPLPQTPYMVYGEGQKLKFWIFILPWSKSIHINLEGIIVPYKQKFDMIY